MSLAVGNRIGNYRIVRQLRDERLGPGAQLAVFLLLHEHTRHEAELRAPTPAQPAELLAPSLARFFQVARGLALVRDPGLIEVLDVDQLPSGQPYVISERPPSGELLSARIARFGRLPEVQAIFIATQLCAVLQAAQRKGLCALTVRPDRVILISEPAAPGGEQARLLLSDRAASELLAPGAPGAPGVREGRGAAGGTLSDVPPDDEPAPYVAPELRGPRPATRFSLTEPPRADLPELKPADVYSLGAVLHVMVAGVPPGLGAALDVTPALRDLLGRMLARERGGRPTLKQVAEALETLQARPSQTLHPIYERIGGYRILRRLGEGGMGVVFEARNTETGHRAAIKVLRPELAQLPAVLGRFLAEARTANAVEHPGVVSIIEQGQLPDGVPYIVMEFLDGESLWERLQKQGGALPRAMTLRLCHQVAEIMAVAHQRGVVHRDLKPENVMLLRDALVRGGERVKLLDFGIAKVALSLEVPGGLRERTRAGAVLGTPLYMAPEQCRAAAHVDDRADVYSLGVMLYQMLSGHAPFEAEAASEVMAMHLYCEARALRERDLSIPGELEALVRVMMAKDPAVRPPMKQVAAELRFLDGAEASLPPRSGDTAPPFIDSTSTTLVLPRAAGAVWIPGPGLGGSGPTPGSRPVAAQASTISAPPQAPRVAFGAARAELPYGGEGVLVPVAQVVLGAMPGPDSGGATAPSPALPSVISGGGWPTSALSPSPPQPSSWSGAPVVAVAPVPQQPMVDGRGTGGSHAIDNRGSGAAPASDGRGAGGSSGVIAGAVQRSSASVIVAAPQSVSGPQGSQGLQGAGSAAAVADAWAVTPPVSASPSGSLPRAAVSPSGSLPRAAVSAPAAAQDGRQTLGSAPPAASASEETPEARPRVTTPWGGVRASADPLRTGSVSVVMASMAGQAPRAFVEQSALRYPPTLGPGMATVRWAAPRSMGRRLGLPLAGAVLLLGMALGAVALSGGKAAAPDPQRREREREPLVIESAPSSGPVQPALLRCAREALRRGARTVYNVWGSGPQDLFAVGLDGLVLRHDGSAWQEQPRVTDADLFGVWGSGSSDVYAVGMEGTLLHFDGRRWRDRSAELPLSVGAARPPLTAISGRLGDDSEIAELWVVGNGVALHRTRGRFRQTPIGSRVLYGVTTTAAGEAWAVGSGGAVLRYEEGRWRPAGPEADLGRGRDLLTLFSRNGELWAGGRGGALLHRDPAGVWASLAVPAELNIMGLSPRSGGALLTGGRGERGAVLWHDGMSARPLVREAAEDQEGVAGLPEVYGAWTVPGGPVFLYGSGAGLLRCTSDRR